MEGGARACAWLPARAFVSRKAKSNQATCSATRSTSIAAVCGPSTGAPVCSTLQTEQHPSWARWLAWSACPASGAPLPWQMMAPASGSEAAMLTAQHAPIGAKICTTRAIRTIGRKFFSRRRIANPSASDLNHPWSPKSRSGSWNYVAASRRDAGEKRCVLHHLEGALPRYQAPGELELNPQPSVVNSQSFRRVLEF
ncbi:hypothetical protein V1290_000658 [Bradyrhizobium sp. AZCC 1578]